MLVTVLLGKVDVNKPMVFQSLPDATLNWRGRLRIKEKSETSASKTISERLT